MHALVVDAVVLQLERMDAEGRDGAACSDEGDLGPRGYCSRDDLCGPNAASICSGDRPARKIDAADASARQRFESDRPIGDAGSSVHRCNRVGSKGLSRPGANGARSTCCAAVEDQLAHRLAGRGRIEHPHTLWLVAT